MKANQSDEYFNHVLYSFFVEYRCDHSYRQGRNTLNSTLCSPKILKSETRSTFKTCINSSAAKIKAPIPSSDTFHARRRSSPTLARAHTVTPPANELSQQWRLSAVDRLSVVMLSASRSVVIKKQEQAQNKRGSLLDLQIFCNQAFSAYLLLNPNESLAVVLSSASFDLFLHFGVSLCFASLSELQSSPLHHQLLSPFLSPSLCRSPALNNSSSFFSLRQPDYISYMSLPDRSFSLLQPRSRSPSSCSSLFSVTMETLS